LTHRVKLVNSNTDRPATKEEFKILSVKKIIFHTADLFEIFLERGDTDFCPGDYVSIYGEDIHISREYSIASGINDPYLGFLIKHISGGIITEYLQHRKKGDSIRISMPEGSFRPGLQHGNEDFIFIATGTGIAPFLSYIKTYPHKPPKKLLYGVRKFTEAVGKEIFNRVCPTELAISREKINGFYSGHLTGLLPHLEFSPRTHFYLCGLDAMIVDVTKWLTKRNVRSDHIHHEIFFHASSSER
jgi:ferredoxin--NADP+ reductase